MWKRAGLAGVDGEKRREAFDETRRETGAREVSQRGVRTFGDDPQGLTPLDSGHGAKLSSGRRVDIDLANASRLSRRVDPQQPEEKVFSVRRALGGGRTSRQECEREDHDAAGGEEANPSRRGPHDDLSGVKA